MMAGLMAGGVLLVYLILTQPSVPIKFPVNRAPQLGRRFMHSELQWTWETFLKGKAVQQAKLGITEDKSTTSMHTSAFLLNESMEDTRLSFAVITSQATRN